MVKQQVLLAWSSGKDSAWALHCLRGMDSVEVTGLLTSFSDTAGRVAVHEVRRELVEAQAFAASLPLHTVSLPWPCPNDTYELRLREALLAARARGVTHIAFGDLFLDDIREYRLKLLEGTGVAPLFPIWCGEHGTRALAHEMVAAGLRATLTCVDEKRMPASFAGREFDAELLGELPPEVDPCAERGEFHTFCHAGPMFSRPIEVRVAGRSSLNQFAYADLVLAETPAG